MLWFSHGLLYTCHLIVISLFAYNIYIFLILECEFAYTLSLAAVVQTWAAPAVSTLAIRVDKYRRALCVVLVGLPHFCGLRVFSRPTFAEHGFNLLRFLLISLMI